MTITFHKTGDVDFPKQLKGLLGGDAKTGKTTALSTLPNVVIADVEYEQHGLASIAHLDVPYVKIDSSATLRTLRAVLSNDELRKKAANQLGLPSIESVSIDTIDQLQGVLQLERQERTGVDFGTGNKYQEDWRWLYTQMKELVESFVALPLHVIFTCHTKLIPVDENRSISALSLQGQIGDKLPGMVGYVFETVKRHQIDGAGNSVTVYQIQTEGDEKSPKLGNRAAGRLPRVMAPDFKEIINLAFGGLQLAQGSSVTMDDGQSSAPTPTPTPAPAETPAPDDAQQAPAPPTEQPQAPTGQSSAQPAPTGEVPAGDNDPIVQVGALQHLDKMYEEVGAVRPPSAAQWRLSKARDVAKWFVACKGDFTQGKLSQEDYVKSVVEGLKAMDAWVDPDSKEVTEQLPEGTIAEVMEWVGSDQDRARRALVAEEAGGNRKGLKTKLKEVLGESEEPSADSTPAESEPAVEPPAEAVDASETAAFEQAVKDELGGRVVQEQPAGTQEEVCENCGEPIEDDALAELSQAKFNMRLDAGCYMKKIREGKAAKEAAQ